MSIRSVRNIPGVLALLTAGAGAGGATDLAEFRLPAVSPIAASERDPAGASAAGASGATRAVGAARVVGAARAVGAADAAGTAGMRIELERSLPLLTTPDAFDALHYDLALEIDLDGERITGTLTLTARVLKRELDRVTLDLDSNLDVSRVLVDGSPAPFVHERDLIRTTIAPPLSLGQEFQVTVDYEGQPVAQGFGSFLFEEHGGVPIVQTFSQPTFARTWWPCKDRPDDKATTDLHVTVPDWMVVGSNGVLIGMDRARDGRSIATWHWRESSPIATYLVSIAATNYVRIDDTYVPATPGSASMPITHYVFPEDSASAAIDFEGVPEMIGLFADRFGEYPFLSEKYGIAEFRHAGAMEHQTLTSYSSGFIQGNHLYDPLVAHELAHQWWGDCVTLQDYRHMWLNEGFATYSEALWQEEVAGREAYLQFFADRDYPFPGTLFDPISIFSFVNYLKGAWVLHMLRGVLGDEAFFDALRSHLAAHAYGNASSWSFQRVVETSAGRDLAWFFQEWVLEEGRPVYEVSWSQGAIETAGGTPLEVRVDQRQHEQTFTMPIPLRIHTTGGVLEPTIWNDERREIYTFWVDARVDSVVLDPEGWVLKWMGSPPGNAAPDIASALDTVAFPPGALLPSSLLAAHLHPASLLPASGLPPSDLAGSGLPGSGLAASSASPRAVATASPNPFRASTEIRFAAPARGPFRLEVFDVAGRVLAREAGVGETGGVTAVRWNGSDQSGRRLPAGTYFYRLVGEELLATGAVVLIP